MWDSESELVGGRDCNNGVLNPSKLSVKTDGFEQSYIPIGVASQYPLLSRSGKMNTIIYETRDSDLEKIVFDDLPGGPEAFELAANISDLRCAAEYLEMTEDLEEGNLIFKPKHFLGVCGILTTEKKQLRSLS